MCAVCYYGPGPIETSQVVNVLKRQQRTDRHARLSVALSIPNCGDESGSSRGVPGSAMARQQQWRVRTWARRGRLWRCAAEVWSCSGSHSDL
ncbi:hypothetical protein CHARACLAT_013211 [Characodon lateralis]|uniref:Uncharacterized protein n=1 Tax=Characodon lateralis TaxID=208331 RepID=A0ABU7DAM3_9TELE|nr:hypothetical protein [Characodon lateralis]